MSRGTRRMGTIIGGFFLDDPLQSGPHVPRYSPDGYPPTPDPAGTAPIGRGTRRMLTNGWPLDPLHPAKRGVA